MLYPIITLCSLKICGSQQRPTRQKISYKNYRQIVIDDFQTDLSDNYEDALKVSADGEDLLEKYYKCTGTVLDHHAPIIVRNTQAEIIQPWFDEKIQDLWRKRRALERQWEKNRLKIHKQMYQDQTKIVCEAIKAAKSKYYTESMSNVHMKTIFKILNSLQHKSPNFFLPKLDTDQAICDAFSTFFISKIDNIMIKIHATVKSKSISSSSLSLPSYLPPPLHHFQPTDETELSKIILKGPLKVMLIRCTSNITAENTTAQLPILCDIINKSMTTGVFPASLKTADVTPLIKKTSLDQGVIKKKYRPVSN